MEKSQKTRKIIVASTVVAVSLSATSVVLLQESGTKSSKVVQSALRDGVTIGKSNPDTARVRIAGGKTDCKGC
jgi:hypothetical protein